MVGRHRGGHDDHLRPVGAQQPDLLARHLVGDGEDAAVALDGGRDGEADRRCSRSSPPRSPRPAFKAPLFSAASMMARPMRSFTEPPGFRFSALPYTGVRIPRAMRCSRTRGVQPIASRMLSNGSRLRGVGMKEATAEPRRESRIRSRIGAEQIEDEVATLRVRDVQGRHRRRGASSDTRRGWRGCSARRGRPAAG